MTIKLAKEEKDNVSCPHGAATQIADLGTTFSEGVFGSVSEGGRHGRICDPAGLFLGLASQKPLPGCVKDICRLSIVCNVGRAVVQMPVR